MLWNTFTESDLAKRGFGKLAIELVEESAWSDDYKFELFLSESNEMPPRLKINHAVFLPELPLVIYDDGTAWTINRVEAEICDYLLESEKFIDHEFREFVEKQAALRKAREQITITDKIWRNVIATFPDADIGKQVVHSRYGLYAFATSSKKETFVARFINNETFCGAVRIAMPPLAWKQVPDGLADHEKHGVFWIALAKAFAAHKLKELGITAEDLDLYQPGIIAHENPNPEHPDPNVVRRVMLRRHREEITILFGSDNLPAEVVLPPE
ncbi:MAG: hypothetical protein ACYC4I_01150 [Minisyncoccota bacterium]